MIKKRQLINKINLFKVSIMSLFLFWSWSCANSKMEQGQSKSQMIYITKILYFQENASETFEMALTDFESEFKSYDLKYLKYIKPSQLAKGKMALPDGILFMGFPSLKAFELLQQSENYRRLFEISPSGAVWQSYNYISETIDTDINLKTGNPEALYAVTMINLKPGELNKTTFDNYLKESCEIMPEFGVGFELFLKPVDGLNETEAPDRIHLFYFQEVLGMQRMMNDERMKALFPERDKSVEDATLIIGKSVIQL